MKVKIHIILIALLLILPFALSGCSGGSEGNDVGDKENIISSNADLTDLILESGTLNPSFDSSKITYSANVDNVFSSITVTPYADELDYEKIEVRVNSGLWYEVISESESIPLGLVVGPNIIEIKVTAEDLSTTKVYTVTVNRSTPLSDNADLSDLVLGGVTIYPSFISSITNYSASVANSETTITVTPKADDLSYDKIEVRINSGLWSEVDSESESDPLGLNPGLNTIEVKVTAENLSSVKSYYISVVRSVPGAVDTSFNNGNIGIDGTVTCIKVQSDTTILVAGGFSKYNGISIPKHIMRLHENGLRDSSFNNGGAGADNSINTIAVQTDGKIIIGGSFTKYNDIDVSDRIMRLNSDGTIDTSFNVGGSGADAQVNMIALQTDGKIVLIGNFSTINGTTVPYGVARLKDDGTVDSNFNNGGVGPNDEPLSVALQTDGKILVGGWFTNYNGVKSPERILRLKSDGTLDNSFNAGGSGLNGSVHCIQPLSDNKCLIGGIFSTYNGVVVNKNIIRLDSDGNVDNTFNNGGIGTNSYVYSIAVQSDNKIIIGGSFAGYNSATLPYYLVRLESNGTMDASFNNGGTGPDSYVKCLAIQADNKIIIGGWFTKYNSVAVPKYLTRIMY
jgi:uncharacterized delta-60 repeat protein